MSLESLRSVSVNESEDKESRVSQNEEKRMSSVSRDERTSLKSLRSVSANESEENEFRVPRLVFDMATPHLTSVDVSNLRQIDNIVYVCTCTYMQNMYR